MRLRPILVALIAAALPAAVAAQDTATLRSFSAMRPTLSDEIHVPWGMATPEGTYRIRDGRSLVQDHTFQISNCRPLAATAALRRDLEGQVFQRCRVVEITTSPACPHCDPHAIEFGDVSFGRHTSSVREDDGRPVTDNWVAHLGIGVRRVRILIAVDRFVLHEWGVADPNMAIIEAPISRPAE